MEKLANLLRSSNVNTLYLNLNALYDYCGDDLIKLIEELGNPNTQFIDQCFVKYEKNIMVLSFFCHFCSKESPHIIRYNMHMNDNLFLDPTVLNLSNHEIFIQVFKYFLNEDVVFFEHGCDLRSS